MCPLELKKWEAVDVYVKGNLNYDLRSLGLDGEVTHSCHSREGGNLRWRSWIPAFAGMTVLRVIYNQHGQAFVAL
jgi:hypothetical protein